MKAQCWCIIGLLIHSCFCRPTVNDPSIRGYLTERVCWWNEVCKEEFQSLFRCKCPQWSYCRSPGRYYNAHCSMTETGYIWTQPDRDWSLASPPPAPAPAPAPQPAPAPSNATQTRLT